MLQIQIQNDKRLQQRCIFEQLCNFCTNVPLYKDREKIYECGFEASYVKQRSKTMKKVKEPKLGYLEGDLIKRIWGNLQD